VHTLKDTWNIEAREIRARGLSDCVEGSWETESAQECIQEWLELDEGDPGFQPLTQEEIAALIFFYLFSSALPIFIKFSIYLFSKFF
jgi:hypothetical protein